MNNYVDEQQIGKGSYGKVYKVKSKSDNEVLVMKKIPLDDSTEADAAVREANVLALLRHPHVVPYKEFFKHKDGDLCLVMAYCEGGDLFQYIKGLKRNEELVDEEQAWDWMVQLLLAVSYCHSKKILHRDVKTQNVFLSQGKVLLGDFGLAKQLQRTLEMARTPIGTPYYMAPEIYDEQPYSFKSDVWALGCVMYELLAQRPAFAADNLSRVVLRVIKGAYDPLPAAFSSDLRKVIELMLNKNVEKRPRANELLQHPAVVKRVQKYLNQLSDGKSWSTWRLKLPPSVLAQMTAAIAGARQSGSSGNNDQEEHRMIAQQVKKITHNGKPGDKDEDEDEYSDDEDWNTALNETLQMKRGGGGAAAGGLHGLHQQLPAAKGFGTPPKAPPAKPAKASKTSPPETPGAMKSGYLPPLGESSFKGMASGKHQVPAGGVPLKSKAPLELMTFSIGQISLQETLLHREAWLWKELKLQLGDAVLQKAKQIVKDMQAKNKGQEGGGVGDAKLRAALQGTVSPAHLELAPLIDELVFIENRMAAGK